MKHILKIIYKIIGFIGLSFIIFLLAGLTEIGFEKIGIISLSIMGIILFVIIEELLKFLPLWQSKVKINPYEYLLVLATVFTFFEFFYGHWALTDLQTISGWTRIVPHYLFVGFYLLGARKNKYLGLGLSTTSHLIWNFIILIFV